MALGKTVFFKKLAGGSVNLHLQDVEGMLPAKWFVMDSTLPRIGVPVNYALSLFVDSSVENMLNKNYFEVENMKDLITIAEERGYATPSPEELEVLTSPKRTKETLLAILKGGNETKIKELFASKDKQRALEIAMQNANVLSLETVDKIEAIVGMAITAE